MKTKIALFIGLLLSTTSCFAELKIGFVDMRTVLEKAPQAEKATKRMELEFSPRQKQLLAQEKEITSKEERMARDGAILGDAERSNLEKDILNKKRDFKRSQQELGEDFNVRRNEELGKLQRRIIEASNAIAKEQHFDLLLYDGVIYSSDKVNVTSQVQQKLMSTPE
ncbi:MAG: OmpH family outer membrane protein [Methylovulum sp.]|jgi:outer membrane protein|nr:OmpH family outer membrane protein [Methylovulum sp.]MCF8007187.1 OmpH family outer membrane protein [Methylovulum sp.]TSA42266.1 MAG: OmpH family outer membrane protein [Methylococcaceae bacterium]